MYSPRCHHNRNYFSSTITSQVPRCFQPWHNHSWTKRSICFPQWNRPNLTENNPNLDVSYLPCTFGTRRRTFTPVFFPSTFRNSEVSLPNSFLLLDLDIMMVRVDKLLDLFWSAFDVVLDKITVCHVRRWIVTMGCLYHGYTSKVIRDFMTWRQSFWVKVVEGPVRFSRINVSRNPVIPLYKTHLGWLQNSVAFQKPPKRNLAL